MAERHEIVLFSHLTLVHGVEVPVEHALNWVVADGMLFGESRSTNSFVVDLCPDHSDPDECVPPCATPLSRYRVSVHAAALDQP